ncbi:MAG TPA: alginate export family protein [Gemmatimonadales bacterium]
MAVPTALIPVLALVVARAPIAHATAAPDAGYAHHPTAWAGVDSTARRTPTADSADTLPLVRVTFGGQARTRAEGVSNYQLGAGPGRRDVHGTTRLVLGARMDVGPVYLGVEGRHAASHGRELPGGARRPNDHDVWDLQAAHVGVRWSAIVPLDVRIGRQPLALGRQRLVGVSDWSNARRAFDGARVEAGLGDVTVEAFRARPVVVHPTRLNRGDSATVLTGAMLGAGDGALQLYALDFDQERATGRQHRRTLGARVTRDATPSRPGLEVEGAWQGGRQDGRRVDAWFVAAELSTIVPAAWSTELTLGLDAASGDGDAADDVVQTFHVPFASSHTHGGYVDVVGRPNAVEARLVAVTTPTERLEIRAAAHRFTRFRMADAVYAKNGATIASGGGSRHVGTELDLTASFRAARGLRVLAGYGHFAPGAALRAAPDGALPTSWGFLGTTFDF